MGTEFFKAYIINGKEHYVYTYTPEDPGLIAIQDEIAFPESLVSMAYLNRKIYEPILEKLSSALSSLYDHPTEDTANEVSELLDELGQTHIYFELLRMAWQFRLEDSRQNGYQNVRELFPKETLSNLMEGLETRQQQIRNLFASVLDMDAPPKKRSRLIILTETAKAIPDYPFSKLPFGFEQTASGEYVEVLFPRDFFDLMDYHLRECLKRKVRMRVCKNCGKYFAVVKNSNAEYCNHPFDTKGRSCREVASILQWNRNRADDTVFKEYRREYKKRFARMKAGTMESAQFYLWSRLAREKKAECESGEITLEEFSEWLERP